MLPIKTVTREVVLDFNIIVLSVWICSRQKRDFQSFFFFKMLLFFIKLTGVKKKDWKKQMIYSFFLYIACSDIHTTIYFGFHSTFEKIIKNAGSGWQLKK